MRPSTRTSLTRCSVTRESGKTAVSRLASQLCQSCSLELNLARSSFTPSAATRPASIISAPLSISALSKASSDGVIKMSFCRSASIERFTLFSVKRLTIWPITATTLLSSSRFKSGVPTFTAMITSAPILRASSTGRLSTRPPSTSRRLPCITGAKTPGTDIEARIAAAKFSPFCNSTRSPLTRSVATAVKGIARLLRSLMWFTTPVSFSKKSVNSWLGTKLSGNTISPLCVKRILPLERLL